MSWSQVYDWNWDCNCRGELLTDYDVTLAGMGTAAGEIIEVPASGYGLGQGYEVLVLYASGNRITLKYTPNDNVVHGYTLHVEDICVEPALLALYRQWNEAAEPGCRRCGLGSRLAGRSGHRSALPSATPGGLWILAHKTIGGTSLRVTNTESRDGQVVVAA